MTSLIVDETNSAADVCARIDKMDMSDVSKQLLFVAHNPNSVNAANIMAQRQDGKYTSEHMWCVSPSPKVKDQIVQNMFFDEYVGALFNSIEKHPLVSVDDEADPTLQHVSDGVAHPHPIVQSIREVMELTENKGEVMQTVWALSAFCDWIKSAISISRSLSKYQELVCVSHNLPICKELNIVNNITNILSNPTARIFGEKVANKALTELMFDQFILRVVNSVQQVDRAEFKVYVDEITEKTQIKQQLHNMVDAKTNILNSIVATDPGKLAQKFLEKVFTQLCSAIFTMNVAAEHGAVNNYVNNILSKFMSPDMLAADI